MKLKPTVFILIALLCIVVIIGRVYLEKIYLCLSNETVSVCNLGPGFMNEDEKKVQYWEEIQRINDKIEIAKFFAQLRSRIGYEYLSGIISRIVFCGNMEYTFSKAYEALGYLGRFDSRSANLLVMEFKPEEDPTRAIDVMRALIISENHTAIIKIKDLALCKLRGYLSSDEREKLLVLAKF